MLNYKGIHYLGGRFVPKAIIEKYCLTIPDYPGLDEIQRLI